MSSSAPATPAGTPPKSNKSSRRNNNMPLRSLEKFPKAVSKESLFLITNAMELLVMYLTKLAQRHGDNDQRVDYKDLAAVVQRKVNESHVLGFLFLF